MRNIHGISYKMEGKKATPKWKQDSDNV